jgi:hypothetical protein
MSTPDGDAVPRTYWEPIGAPTLAQTTCQSDADASRCCESVGAQIPRRYPERDRTGAASAAYLIHVPDEPKTQVTSVFELANRAFDKPVWNGRSALEIASQAEYAGSIPVIGSTFDLRRHPWGPAERCGRCGRSYNGPAYDLNSLKVLSSFIVAS